MGRLFSRSGENNSVMSDSPVAPKNRQWTKALKAVFLLRMPLWVVAAIFVFLGGFNVYQALSTDSPTNLNPAIKDAPAANIRITMCNQRVDDIGLNVRNEELRLEKRFRDVENVEEPRVSIERENCKEDSQK